jgi:tyrosinase
MERLCNTTEVAAVAGPYQYRQAKEAVVSRAVHSRGKSYHPTTRSQSNKNSLQINLGPLSPGMAGETKVATPFAYNPRCAKRDLTTYSSTNWLTYSNLYNITLGPASGNIELFQNELQGRFPEGLLGLHAAGHYAIGGDASDFYSSPNDPVFFMHHAMLDRVWWLWQAIYPTQANTIAGTITLMDKPPSRNATMDDLVETNYLDMEALPISSLLDTLGGEPFCYIYV